MAKICRTCRRNKPLVEFTVHNQRADGWSIDCRACQKAKRKGASAPVQAVNTNVKAWVKELT